MFSIFKKKKEEPEEKVTQLKAFTSGAVIGIENVADEVFSSKALGDGLAINPTTDYVVAPADATISLVMEDSKHAVGMNLNNGAEILIHVGIDTVNLNGEGFALYVKPGDKVKAGDKLISFDSELIKSKGLQTTTMLVLTNQDDFPNVQFVSEIEAVLGETVIVKF